LAKNKLIELKEMLQIEDNKNEFLAEQLELLRAKQKPDSDVEWEDICALRTSYDGSVEHRETIRKGSKLLYEYLSSGWINPPSETVDTSQIDKKIQELQKERYKLQATKIAPNRASRQDSRFEMFYENIAKEIKELEPPEFEYVQSGFNLSGREYLLSIADIHAGSTFVSLNNEYNLDICEERFNKLYSYVIDYVKANNISMLKVLCLGDDIQGILRISDLKLNEKPVVESTVFVARLLSEFLNKLSQYVNVDFIFCPTSNHSQIRPLGTKHSELASEDIEYIIGNYISDVLVNNDRININLNFGKEYILFNIAGFDSIAMHGHQIKNVINSIKDLSMQHKKFFSYLFLAHFHSATEIIAAEGDKSDIEVLVCPPFIGSCPYSDSLGKGAKASCKIFSFDPVYGHVGTEKIILN
jgi:hypothetical protein